jgi:hypothetical protein
MKYGTVVLPPTNQIIMTKYNVSEKNAKFQSQRLEGQGHGTKWKVLSEGIHEWNTKTIPPTSPKLKF